MKYRYRISFIIESPYSKNQIHEQLTRIMNYLHKFTSIKWLKLETERTEVTEEIEVEPEIKEESFPPSKRY
tara:strand:+ start:151 stop:363 length:213 start_codon:yes stop_codon:yes gene_type:complete